MKRTFNIGAAIRSTEIEAFQSLSRLYDDGILDHVQVQLIPVDDTFFRPHLDIFSSANIPILIHAPHHRDGVNPCAPSAFEDRPLKVMEAIIEHAMAQTLEAADVLDSDFIVLHAGRYEPERKEEAMATMREFLELYRDPRIILENLPEVFGGHHFLGTGAGELFAIGNGFVDGYCLDFAHLYCTANYWSQDFTRELKTFEKIPVQLFHLSNTEYNSVTDRHLELDHPDGGIDFTPVFEIFARQNDIPITLEFKDRRPSVYEEQVNVFESLYSRYHA